MTKASKKSIRSELVTLLSIVCVSLFMYIGNIQIGSMVIGEMIYKAFNVAGMLLFISLILFLVSALVWALITEFRKKYFNKQNGVIK